MSYHHDTTILSKDDIKDHFVAREGFYRCEPQLQYARQQRESDFDPGVICYNIGKELFIFPYHGVYEAVDLAKPLDKRTYKSTYPTSHDIAASPDGNGIFVIIGFSLGQIQLIEPITKGVSKLYNEDRSIDKGRVTCIRWIPTNPSHFLVSYTSGQMYMYKHDVDCPSLVPNYQLLKKGDGFAVYTCKTKSTRNPLYRWTLGRETSVTNGPSGPAGGSSGAVNMFVFSPCSRYLAVVTADGYLRVFDFDPIDLVGVMRSYFGGLLCCSWSPDGKYIVVGGEDDLLTVWSFKEKRVVCRGFGHESWINQVAFDPHLTARDYHLGSSDSPSGAALSKGVNGSDAASRSEDVRLQRGDSSAGTETQLSVDPPSLYYRIGSVGQDTLLCLWDLTDDVLAPATARSYSVSSRGATTATSPTGSGAPGALSSMNHVPSLDSDSGLPSDRRTEKGAYRKVHSTASTNSIQPVAEEGGVATSPTNPSSLPLPSSHPPPTTTHTLNDAHSADGSASSNGSSNVGSLRKTFGVFSVSRKKDRQLKKQTAQKAADTSVVTLGSQGCPRLTEVPLIEPAVNKRIADERLTDITFQENCIVVACQLGYVSTWIRPGKENLFESHYGRQCSRTAHTSSSRSGAQSPSAAAACHSPSTPNAASSSSTHNPGGGVASSSSGGHSSSAAQQMSSTRSASSLTTAQRRKPLSNAAYPSSLYNSADDEEEEAHAHGGSYSSRRAASNRGDPHYRLPTTGSSSSYHRHSDDYHSSTHPAHRSSRDYEYSRSHANYDHSSRDYERSSSRDYDRDLTPHNERVLNPSSSELRRAHLTGEPSSRKADSQRGVGSIGTDEIRFGATASDHKFSRDGRVRSSYDSSQSDSRRPAVYRDSNPVTSGSTALRATKFL